VTQGLALGAGLPVIGIGTLEAMAEACGGNAVICCLDARMKEVYCAAYRRGDGDEWSTVVAPGLYSPRAMPRLAAGNWTGCGNAFVAYRDALAEAWGNTLTLIRPEITPHARFIAALAAREFARDGGRRPEEALPVYIRDKVALTIEEQR
jgi:tRNA threonylcarbamoyladenosine biosynthesis protein TsaB